MAKDALTKIAIGCAKGMDTCDAKAMWEGCNADPQRCAKAILGICSDALYKDSPMCKKE